MVFCFVSIPDTCPPYNAHKDENLLGWPRFQNQRKLDFPFSFAFLLCSEVCHRC